MPLYGKFRLATCSALLLLIGLLLPPSTAPAEEAAASEIPPAREYYMGRKIATTMHFLGAPWLTRENRERQEECSTLLAELKLKPGMIVSDLGCGNGFYTLQMAPQVAPGGKILAVDIQQEMLRLLQDRAEQNDLDNVELILGDFHDPKLPEGKVDLILCVDAYHEFSHPELMLRNMRKALAPQGRLVLVEFRAEDPEVPIKPLHKMSKAQVNKELTANGYKLVEQFDKLPWQHVMFFERDETWQEPAEPTPYETGE